MEGPWNGRWLELARGSLRGDDRSVEKAIRLSPADDRASLSKELAIEVANIVDFHGKVDLMVIGEMREPESQESSEFIDRFAKTARSMMRSLEKSYEWAGLRETLDKVIALGDALFGSTVTGLDFLNGLNDAGDVAFLYHLADGRQGIAVASVPEPAGLALLAIGACAALPRRRAQRRTAALSRSATTALRVADRG